jgi:protein gp37
MAARFSDPGMWGHGFATRTPGGGRWTGKVEVQWDRLELPLGWQRPTRIFASSTSDWFHEKLPLQDIATLFGVAVAAVHLRRHTIQILTKRAARMRELLTCEEFWEVANAVAGDLVMERTDPLARRSDDARATLDDYGPDNPPPGIWLGISAEDQPRADERIPHLLATPAAVRFVSAEPLLGPIDFRNVGGINAIADRDDRIAHAFGHVDPPAGVPLAGVSLDWIIVGGESGHRARDNGFIENARSILAQCRAAGTAFCGKQGVRRAPLPPDLQVREMPEASP